MSDYVDIGEMADSVFASSDVLKREFVEEAKKAGIPEKVYINRDLALKSTKSHKIKTDTGIEISFPADYTSNSDYIEFINNPDGTISIELKNIGKIVNK